ncbi:phage tail tip protein J-related protein [Proteus mirabilis]|uniref:phage tail tip protein J-related protein n=5 Tax=Proteus mirabilis TaxID=584 RepID=UPI00128F493C|nr:DUF1983 domain-containing protein [Proteus mirabilis]QFV06085.1 DUF1983 domain-containing protein [Proteus mirabilis]
MGKTVTSVVSAGLMIAGVIATGGLGTALIVAGIAVQAASAFIFKDKVPGSGYRDQSERKQMLRSASAPETVVVGKTMMSGLLFFAEEEEGEQDENEELYMALAIASHPIHKLGQIYFNDDKIEDLGDNAQYEFHNGRTEADPYLLKHAPSWKEDMIGRGLAWLRLTLRFDQEKFPYGVPNVKSELWGKEIYDPRTEKTAWSNNGALVILDYYRHYLGVPDSDIDWNAFKVAADICDETVQTPDGKSEPRYTLNGAYELEESPASVLEMMHKCIAGEPTYIAGKHGILMQVYNGPALLTIDESQIIDTVTVTPELSLRDATNAIYGTFVDAEQQYNKTDFEPVVIEEWIEEDGLEIKENMDYRFVTSPYQANRLANLYLRKKRAGRRIQLRMNLDGYAYRPGDVVKLELPSLGISDLEFRIADWKFHPSEGVEITLEEDGPYIYEDLASKPFVRPPFTKLPTGGVPAPINLAFVPLSVTDIVQGYISWQNVASDIRYNTVNILQNGKVIQSIQVPGERVDINGLTRGTYRVEVRAINVAGAMSAPAISDFAIQAPPAPISVEITPGMFSLTASPRQGDSAVFGYTFEFWFSEKKLANLSENEVITKTNKVGQGQFWTKDNLKAGTDYWFYVRTVNSYGKSQFVEAVGQASGTPKDMVDELGDTFLTNEAGQIMQEQIDFSKEAIAELELDTIDVKQKVVSIDRDVEAVNEAVMMNTKFTTEVHFSLKEEVADRKAEIFRIEQVQVTDREAAARWQEQITAKVDYNASEILNIKDAQSSYEKATAQQISQVKADVDGVKSRVTTVETATADLKQSQAKFEQSTTAEFGEMRGYITHFETSLSNVELAVSEAIMQTTAQVNQHSSELLQSKADVKRIANATATNEKATAELAESVKAHYEDSQAEFVDVRKSIAEKDKAHSERTEQVRAELGKDINANKEEIDKTNKELSDISAAVTTNTKAIAETDKTLTELEQVSSSRFDSNEATIANIQNTQANSESSQAETTLQLAAQQNEQGTELLRAKASITRIDKVVADNNRAFAQSIEKLETQFDDVNSSITTLKKTVSDNERSQAEINELIKSEIGENKSAIEQRGQTIFDHNGNGSAIYTIKTGINWNNQYYDAKFMMGAEVRNGKVVTQIGFSADTFGIFNPSSGKLEPVFFVENGQVFINEGVINKAIIEKIIVGTDMRSKNYVAGKTGTRIDMNNGTIEINGSDDSGSRMTIKNDQIAVYAGGKPKIVIGRLYGI